MIYNENNRSSTPILLLNSEEMTNNEIKILNYNYQQIKYFPRNFFIKYSHLKELNLSNNKIYFLSENLFNHLENLKILDLSNNFINKINKDTFKFLRKLTILNLSNNNLEKIKNYTFNYLYKLISLNLNSNKLSCIEEYGFYDISKLRYLFLQNNVDKLNIHAKNYEYLKSIKYLYTSTEDRINKFKNLRILSFMNIYDSKSLQISNLYNLYSLRISNTYIKKIYKNTFYNLPNLNYINISYNYDLKEIDDNIFNNTNNLKIIFINYNPNLYLFKLIFSLLHLQYLHLNDNNINNIKKNMCFKCKSLKELYLQNNNLEKFDVILPRFLNKLYLKNNNLNEVIIKKNKLKILDLQNNLLTKLYINKNNIPNLNVCNNLLLQNNYVSNYIFPYSNQILYILHSISNHIFYYSCFEIYNNIEKFYCLKINMIEILNIIKICNYPEILKKYFYKLYILCFLKKYIKNKKKLKYYYFKSIKDLQIIYNIHYTHKYIFNKISEYHVRNHIFDYILLK